MVWARMTAAVVTATVVCGCSDAGRGAGEPVAEQGLRQPAAAPAMPPPPTPTSTPTPAPRAEDQPAPRPPRAGAPQRAALAVPAIGVTGLEVVPYRGRTDDARGTVIQDRGHAASPHGPRGGVGPGGIGNYQVTAHRTSSTRAFARLPELRRGDRVVVTTPRVRYIYRVVDTRRTSFRSVRSLAAQRAAVPGRPGARPTRAMITLSTCATPEDRAAGNDWSDRFGNPEHRIDKIGILVRWSPHPQAG
jgi:sortase A